MVTTVIEAFNKFLANTVNLDPEKTKKARGSRDWLSGFDISESYIKIWYLS